MPASLAYYDYDGSFTTPSCTEGVNWFVLDATIEVSQEQVDEFRGLEFMSHEGEFFGNNRPVQPLNGRLVGAQATATATPTATASPTATATANGNHSCRDGHRHLHHSGSPTAAGQQQAPVHRPGIVLAVCDALPIALALLALLVAPV